MNPLFIYCGIVGAILLMLIVIIKVCYVKAPPSEAYLISGISSQPRILIGRGGFKVPFLERLDKVYLGQITVDIKTSSSVPTKDFINVMVDAVSKVRIIPTVEGIRLAGKNFLNMDADDISRQLTDSLEGNMREVVGALDLKPLNNDRDGFSDQITTKASPDMEKLGIEILSCNIQNITDENNLIKDLGADNTYAIKKTAAITKATSERDIAIEQAKARKEANDAKVESDTAIAERNNELAIKQAELKILSDTKNADADAAYEIQKQEKQKTINVKTVDAKIEQTKREQVLSEERIQITQNTLKSEINAKADAQKYQTEVSAQADLEFRKRQAEAEAYEAEQRAKAVKAAAEARKYEMMNEAEGIKAKGQAEADALAAKLSAEAEGLEKKATAYEKYGQAAILDMMVKIMPEMAQNIAKPLESIDNVNIYGTTGSEVAGIAQNVPTIMKQTMDMMSNITGVNMTDIVKSNTIAARTDRNVNIDGKSATVQINS